MIKQKGFTLIELLIVIAIIATLAAIVLVSLDEGRTRAKEATFASYVSSAMRALEGEVAEGKITAGMFESWQCLGGYDGNECWNGPRGTDLNALLFPTGNMPEGQFSAYETNERRSIMVRARAVDDHVRVAIYVGGGLGPSMCDSFGLEHVAVSGNDAYCNGYFYYSR